MSGPPPASPADVDAVAHVIVDDPTDDLVVDGPAGHHLVRVRRLRAGERITAADGLGTWREYRVVEAGARGLVIAAEGPRRIEPAPTVGIAVAVAVTKGGLDDVVTAVTELGAVRVVPLLAERVVARWDPARAERAGPRLGLVARAAAEQSRRARLPVIDPLTPVGDLVGRSGLVVADRRGLPAPLLDPPTEGEWTVAVGPEGGFSPEESQAFGACPRLGLGPHVLRAATAPVAAVAALGARLAEWSP